MNGIVERLRDPEFQGPMQHLRPWDEIDALHAEAAANIEALEAENARDRDTVKRLDEIFTDLGWDGVTNLHVFAGAVIAKRKAAKADRDCLAAQVKALREGLARQCDSVAFLLNNTGMPGSWFEKLNAEITEDRTLLATTEPTS